MEKCRLLSFVVRRSRSDRHFGEPAMSPSAAVVAEDEMWNRGWSPTVRTRKQKKTDIGCLLPVIRMLPRLSVHGRGFRPLLLTLNYFFSSRPSPVDASIAVGCVQN